MSFTAKVMAANFAAPAIGVAGAAFGKAMGFNLWQFVIFSLLMAASIAAGGLALYSETQTKAGVSEEEVLRTRRRIIGSFIAKFLLGMVVVSQIDAKPWMVVMVGLGLGGGSVIWTMLADLRKGLSGDDVKPPDGG